MRVVLDTNVIVSAFLSPLGHSGQILAAWRNQEFELVLSQEILNEYAETLAYPKINSRLGFSPAEIDEITQGLQAAAVFLPEVEIEVSVVAADPDDNILFAAAIEGQAQFIVS